MECRICGNNYENKVFQVKEMQIGLKHVFDYFECQNCKCLQIVKVPKNLSEYYDNNYYSFNASPSQNFKGIKGIIKKIRVYNSLHNPKVSFLGKMKTYSLISDLNIDYKTKILDVGCGTGYFLYPFTELGFQNLLGVDPYIPHNITYPNGLRILKKDIFDVDGLWDIIMYHHSFEHLIEPLENLEKANLLLTKGGICLIRIPTVSSFAWQRYGIHWYQIDSPRHIFLHSLKSMDILAKKAGFDVIKIVYDSENTQFIISEKYKKGYALNDKFYKGLLGRVQKKIDKYKYSRKAKKLNKLNLGDQAAFFLQKL